MTKMRSGRQRGKWNGVILFPAVDSLAPCRVGMRLFPLFTLAAGTNEPVSPLHDV